MADSDYYMTEVGEFENSASPYGTFDQGGNVWEWNETVIGSLYRGRLGGSWNYEDYTLKSSARWADFPTLESSNQGFRVANAASVPEPGSIALLICGLMACVIWWRRGR